MDSIVIKLNKESLAYILKNNLACYVNQMLTHDLLAQISEQIIETIEFVLSKDE